MDMGKRRSFMIKRKSSDCLIWCGLLPLLAYFFTGLYAVQAVEIKVATVAPDGSGWMTEMRVGAELIKEKTEGRVTFKFYPGGVMGNDSQVLRKIRVGQLQGGAFAGGGLAERYAAINLYSIPLLFRSFDELDFIRDRMDSRLAAGLERSGFVTFGFVEGGFARMMANEPISKIEDMQRRKVWVPDGDQVSFLSMEALGLSPVVLPPTDVLTGLQTGLLDVVAASPVVALILQWHTKIKFVTDLPVAYSMGIFALDARVFKRLSDSDQQTVRAVMEEVNQSLDEQARMDNQRAREVMEEIGISFVSVDPVDVSSWHNMISEIYPRIRSRDEIDEEFFDELLMVLQEYRDSTATGY
jgi:TRAP-type C4-dicarboxylate transport system substrate-binding protein